MQLQAFLNDWQGGFFDVVQRALSKPGSVSPGEYWPYVITLMAVLLPNIIFLVLMAFFTSHYVFRWRKAMTSYYMRYWPAVRTTEGAAQRVQEDTMRFASIVEDLGTSAAELLAMCAHEGTLPIDVLMAVCEKAGCADTFDELRA